MSEKFRFKRKNSTFRRAESEVITKPKISGNNRFTKFSYPWGSLRSFGARSSAIANELLVILVLIFLSYKQTFNICFMVITGSFWR